MLNGKTRSYLKSCETVPFKVERGMGEKTGPKED
jgi:hypothetical protein